MNKRHQWTKLPDINETDLDWSRIRPDRRNIDPSSCVCSSRFCRMGSCPEFGSDIRGPLALLNKEAGSPEWMWTFGGPGSRGL